MLNRFANQNEVLYPIIYLSVFLFWALLRNNGPLLAYFGALLQYYGPLLAAIGQLQAYNDIKVAYNLLLQ